MSITREKLLPVGGLALSGVIDDMSNEQFDEYCSELIAFVESFPTHEVSLKSSLGIKDYAGFSRTLSRVREVLKKIHANGLEFSCRRLLDELSVQKFSIVEAHLTYLLAEISGLSIDIQMAAREGAPPADADAEAQAPAQGAAGQAGEKIILAVDDVSFLLFGLKSVLQNTQYKFVGVTSGEAALKFVEKHTPDLFILDIEMPEMNGYELTKRLRKCGQKAPVIFLTGNASVDYVRKAMEVGAADFIVKPVNEARVIEKITKLIG